MSQSSDDEDSKPQQRSRIELLEIQKELINELSERRTSEKRQMEIFTEMKATNSELFHLKELECIICCKQQKSIVFNCGHVQCCTDCSLPLKRCPICRKHITERKVAFL